MGAADLPLGEFRNLPAEQHHASPALGSSALRELGRSPFHYWAKYRAPGRPEIKPTAAMRQGTLVHCLTLEPNQFDARYIVLPDDAPVRPTARQWAAKKPTPGSLAAMRWWTEFNEQASGREIIAPADLELAQAQRDALLRVPEIAELLRAGHSETSYFWVDRNTGVYCKARPDHVRPRKDGRVTLVDIKSTVDPLPAAFSRSIHRFGYHHQAVHYSAGVTECLGVGVAEFVLCAVSSQYPFVAIPYVLREETLEQARDEVDALLQLHAGCEEAGRWPVCADGVQPIGLPGWAERGSEVEVSDVD